MKILSIFALLAALALPLSAQAAGGGAAPTAATVSSVQHFHPKGKMPSEHTLKVFETGMAPEA